MKLIAIAVVATFVPSSFSETFSSDEGFRNAMMEACMNVAQPPEGGSPQAACAAQIGKLSDAEIVEVTVLAARMAADAERVGEILASIVIEE